MITGETDETVPFADQVEPGLIPFTDRTEQRLYTLAIWPNLSRSRGL